ncbi:MAG TPA: helix-turn-helix transcriptional regulator [Micromonosporaceae bacterium]
MPDSRLVSLVGSVVRSQREQHGLTQRQLADRAGVDQATVARIERGRQAASLPMLETLLAALDAQLAISVEPLDAHLDAAIAEIAGCGIADRIADTGIAKVVDRLPDIPYVITGPTAALLQGAPVPVTAVHLALRWQDSEIFTDWLSRMYGRRWHAKWQVFGYLRLDPREFGDHRWQTLVGEIVAAMCDELPESIEVRHTNRLFRVVPLAQLELSDPAAAGLLRRYRERMARSAG